MPSWNKGFLNTRNKLCEKGRVIDKLDVVFETLNLKIKVSQRNWLTFFVIPSIVCNGATTPNYRSLKLRCKVSKPLSRNFQQLFFPGAVMKTFRISFPGTWLKCFWRQTAQNLRNWKNAQHKCFLDAPRQNILFLSTALSVPIFEQITLILTAMKCALL